MARFKPGKAMIKKMGSTKGARIKGKPITAKQRKARIKNIAIARRYKKKGAGAIGSMKVGGKLSGAKKKSGNKKVKRRVGGGKGERVTSAAKYRGYDKRVAVKTKWQKKAYKEQFKKSYKRTKGAKFQRAAKAHAKALKVATSERKQYWGGLGGTYQTVTYRVPGSKYRPRRKRR